MDNQKIYNLLFDPIRYFFLPLLILLSLVCDKPTRSHYDEIKSLKLRGRVTDRFSNEGVVNAKVRFYSIYRPAETIAYTDTDGYFRLETFDVYCSEFVTTPDYFDPMWRANDRYFISATKAGYDTLTSGAFFANIFCFDVEQIVNLRITHLKYKDSLKMD